MTENEKKDREAFEKMRIEKQKTFRLGMILLAIVAVLVASIFIPWGTVGASGVGINADTGTVIGGLLIVATLAAFLYDHGKTKKAEIETGSPKSLVRLGIFVIFHALIACVLWSAFNYFFYEPLGGEGFIKSTLDLVICLLVTASAYDSWDGSTIKLNEKAEILIFNKGIFSDVPPGIVCLGLPYWIGSSMKSIDFKSRVITIGLIQKDGTREQFIVECNGFRAIFDVVFEVRVMSTRLYLKLGGDEKSIEKRIVAEINAAFYDVANSVNADSGNKNYPDIDSLKAATADIQKQVFDKKSLHERLTSFGFQLIQITLKDVENEDRAIITAAQELKARKFIEDAEMLDIESTVRKAELLFQKMNLIGSPNEVLPDNKDHFFTMVEAMKAVQLAEGRRTQINVDGSNQRTFLALPSK